MDDPWPERWKTSRSPALTSRNNHFICRCTSTLVTLLSVKVFTFLGSKRKTPVNKDRMFSTSFAQPFNDGTFLYSLIPKIAALSAITTPLLAKCSSPESFQPNRERALPRHALVEFRGGMNPYDSRLTDTLVHRE